MSVYSVKLAGVGRGYAITEDDQKLILTGNRTFRKGDIAWTDGRYIYGTEAKHGGTLVSASTVYFPYLSHNQLNRMSVNGNPKTLNAIDRKVGNPYIFVAGEKASYIIIDYWYTATCYNLKTGAVFVIDNDYINDHLFRGPLHATVDNNGNLLTAWATPSECYEDEAHKLNASICIMKNDEVIGLVPTLYAFKSLYDWNVSYAFRPYCLPLWAHLRKDGTLQGLFISSSASNTIGFTEHAYYVSFDYAYTDCKVVAARPRDDGELGWSWHTLDDEVTWPARSGGSIKTMSMSVRGKKIEPFRGFCLQMFESKSKGRHDIVLYDSRTNTQKSVAIATKLLTSWKGDYYNTQPPMEGEHPWLSDGFEGDGSYIAEAVADWGGGYKVIVLAKIQYDGLPIPDRRVDFLGSESTPFQLEVGSDKNGKPIEVEYNIKATGIEPGNGFGELMYDITSKMDGCRTTVNTILRPHARDYEHFVTSAYSHQGQNFYLTSSGLYKAGKNGKRLLSPDFQSGDVSSNEYNLSLEGVSAVEARQIANGIMNV